MKTISAEQIEHALDFPSLIEVLRNAFATDCHVPQRHHHDYQPSAESTAATLLLMPAWQGDQFFGLKIITVTPENTMRGLPSIQGQYLLFDTATGSPCVQMDAKMLTHLRTAAASALASSYLSGASSHTLLMIGTGALASYLIRAHATVRPIQRVFVWGRDPEKARQLAQSLSGEPWSVEVAPSLEKAVSAADIVSAATMAEQPLIRGKWLRPGQHLDLVGSYKPNMREADDLCIQRATIFVDTRTAAPRESGDLAVPIQKGILSETDIQADLFELCRESHPGRKHETEITLFKSVGHALEDLAAARLVYQKLSNVS